MSLRSPLPTDAFPHAPLTLGHLGLERMLAECCCRLQPTLVLIRTRELLGLAMPHEHGRVEVDSMGYKVGPEGYLIGRPPQGDSAASHAHGGQFVFRTEGHVPNSDIYTVVQAELLRVLECSAHVNAHTAQEAAKLAALGYEVPGDETGPEAWGGLRELLDRYAPADDDPASRDARLMALIDLFLGASDGYRALAISLRNVQAGSMTGV